MSGIQSLSSRCCFVLKVRSRTYFTSTFACLVSIEFRNFSNKLISWSENPSLSASSNNVFITICIHLIIHAMDTTDSMSNVPLKIKEYFFASCNNCATILDGLVLFLNSRVVTWDILYVPATRKRS